MPNNQFLSIEVKNKQPFTHLTLLQYQLTEPEFEREKSLW